MAQNLWEHGALGLILSKDNETPIKTVAMLILIFLLVALLLFRLEVVKEA